jgi:glucose-1-phosphate cytidylyltransferase
MQVVILCGGQGTRIRDIAEDIPKPMIPVGDRPILWHIMKLYARHGYTEFVLCLGYKSWTIKRYFLDYHFAGADLRVELGDPSKVRICGGKPAEDWRITLVETGQDAMTGCRVKRIEKYITGDQFLLTYGDGLANVSIDSLVDFHLKHGKIGTVSAVQAPGRFGELELSGLRVVEFSEKPLLSRGRINGGYFVFRCDIFDRLQDDVGLVLEDEPLMQLARDGELMAFLHDGFWQCMDSSRDYRFLNDLWAQGRAVWETPATTQSLRAAA